MGWGVHSLEAEGISDCYQVTRCWFVQIFGISSRRGVTSIFDVSAAYGS
jgi:hypothetical protein